MDVRCEKCKTDYVFDEARISEAGVTVRCTECQHIFKVYKRPPDAPRKPAKMAVGPASEQDRPWLLRKRSGEAFSFDSLATLHKWIIERRVARDDEISRSGQSWKELGDIAELAPFFHVVDQASRAIAEASASSERPVAEQSFSSKAAAPVASPLEEPGKPEPVSGEPSWAATPAAAPTPDVSVSQAPAWAHSPHGPPPQASLDASSSASSPLGVTTGRGAALGEEIGALEDEDFEEFRKSGGKARWVVLLLLLVVAGGGAFYYMEPDLALGLIGLGEPAEEEQAFQEGERDRALAAEDDAVEEEVGADQDGLAKEESEAEVEVASSKQEEKEPEVFDDEDKKASPPETKVSKAPPPEPPRPTYQGLLQQATNARNRGQIETALDLYARASAMRPNQPDGYVGQGFCYIEMRAWHAAIASFEQALEHSSRHGEAIIGLAEANKHQGNSEEARRLYERYLELYPQGPEAAVARTNLDME